MPRQHARTILVRAAGVLALLSLLLMPVTGAAAAPGPHSQPLAPVLADLHGPDEPSILQEPPATDWQAYQQGTASRLAILLAGEQGGTWLALVEGLRALGVPVTVTRDWQEAVQHRMVVVYPGATARTLPPLAQAGLRDLAQRGGRVVGFGVQGAGVSRLFGVKDPVPARNRFEFHFVAAWPSPRETRVPIGSREHLDFAPGSYAYTPVTATVLASYDSGEPAILDQRQGPGHLYTLGVDIADLAARGFSNRQEWVGRSYVNQYEPAADVMFHWLKDRYREAEPWAVTLSGSPDGRALPVIITHDLDFLQSMRNALEYLGFEREAGIRATYFIQTKYVRDWEDEAFLDTTGIDVIRQIAAAGMEIGSHTVAHSRVFASMPQGSGVERFPDYRPVIASAQVCEGCSIFGELRVRRFLLERLGGEAPVSFRPGQLADPRSLPESMAATGFLYGSSETANNTLSHLPIHTHFHRDRDTQLPVWEFPITIEDEEAPQLGDRVGAALAVAKDVIRDEGIFVVLIHPNVVSHKLKFERELVSALRDQAWFGTIGEFGGWWAARDAVQLDVQPAPAGSPAAALPTLHLKATQSIRGLTLQLPPGTRLAVGPAVLSCTAGRAVLARFNGELDLPLLPSDP